MRFKEGVDPNAGAKKIIKDTLFKISEENPLEAVSIAAMLELGAQDQLLKTLQSLDPRLIDPKVGEIPDVTEAYAKVSGVGKIDVEKAGQLFIEQEHRKLEHFTGWFEKGEFLDFFKGALGNYARANGHEEEFTDCTDDKAVFDKFYKEICDDFRDGGIPLPDKPNELEVWQAAQLIRIWGETFEPAAEEDEESVRFFAD